MLNSNRIIYNTTQRDAGMSWLAFIQNIVGQISYSLAACKVYHGLIVFTSAAKISLKFFIRRIYYHLRPTLRRADSKPCFTFQNVSFATSNVMFEQWNWHVWAVYKTKNWLTCFAHANVSKVIKWRAIRKVMGRVGKKQKKIAQGKQKEKKIVHQESLKKKIRAETFQIGKIISWNKKFVQGILSL